MIFEPGVPAPSGTAPWSGVTPQQWNSWQYRAQSTERQVDLAVVGGGLSGVAAALAAARRGVKVAVLENLHMLGGQATTSGVSAFDLTMFYDQSINGHGLWSEILTRLSDEYSELGLAMNTSRYRDNSLAANPVIIDRVLLKLLQEARVTILRATTVLATEFFDDSVRLTTTRGNVDCTLVVDATEDGSMLAHAGIPYHIGNSVWNPGEEFPESRIQDITQVAVIRYFPDGLDDSQVLPKHRGFQKYRDRALDRYSTDPGRTRKDPRAFAGYRAIPDIASGIAYAGSDWESVTRTSLNFHNDLPVTTAYLTDPAAQSAYEKDATELTLAILYYLQSELHQPWALAEDEGFGAFSYPRRFSALKKFSKFLPHLPPRPYIRESRRGIGLDTLTGKDIFRTRNRAPARWNVDAIAVGTYPPDLHGGRDPEDLEAHLDEYFTDKPKGWREGPFPIPLGTLISKDLPRLLFAEKNIATSRIASGATRLHATVTAIGEAVGTLAAISILKNVSPSNVPAPAVQMELANGGALLAPFALAGITRGEDDFGDVSFAVARQATPVDLIRHPNQEPLLRPLDRTRAGEVGRALASQYSAWALPRSRH